MRANRARLWINLLAVLALIVSVAVRNEVVSAVLALLCMLAALAVLYFNLASLSNVSKDNPKLKAVRAVTVFNVLFMVGIVLFAVLAESGVLRLTENQGRGLLAAVFAVPIAFFGNLAPKLPFNRYTGLRLPWTVRDEETWIVAHRILGYLSLPAAVMCLMGLTVDGIGEWLVGVLLVWIGIPSALSGIFFFRKWR